MTYEREAPTWRDVEAVARLVGDLSDPGLAPGERDQHFLSGAACLLGAKLGFLIRAEHTALPREPGRINCMYDYGVGGSERDLLQAYAEANGRDDPTVVPTVEPLQHEPVLTPMAWLRDELISAKAFYGSPHYRLCEAIGADDRIMASIRVSERRLLYLSLHRGPGERPFGERQRRLAKTVLAQAVRALAWNRVPFGGFLRKEDGTVLDLKQTQAAVDELFGLSTRETEVARWVARGLTNKEIARELGLSPETIKRHVSNALEKSGSESRTELAYLVLTLGGA